MTLRTDAPELDELLRSAHERAWRPAAAASAWAAVQAADLTEDFIGSVARRLREGDEIDPTHAMVVEALVDELAALAMDQPQDRYAAVRAGAGAAVVAATSDHPGLAALDATGHAWRALDDAGRAALAETLREVVAAHDAPPEPEHGPLTAVQARAAAEAFAALLGARVPAEPDATALWERALEGVAGDGAGEKPGDVSAPHRRD